MSEYDGVVRGPNGFSYETLSTEGLQTEVRIRDSMDELFAIARYSPNPDKYEISLDLGFSGRKELREIGLFELMDLKESYEPDMTGILGEVEPSEINRYNQKNYWKIQDGEDIFEFENINQEDKKTLARITSNRREIASVAEKIVNSINPPFIESGIGDPYRKSWKPYEENSSRVILADDEEAIQKVFDTAFNLSEDILDDKTEIRDE